MNKQEQIEEMEKIIDELYNVYTTTAGDIADGIYNAGYRKTFTSDIASDTQKAYKEGYIKATNDRGEEIAELNAENAILKTNLKKLEEKCEELLNEKWDAQDDLDCYYDEMPNKIKQAKIDVLNELKSKSYVNDYCREVVEIEKIDELLKEYE